jgi:hypothetical protein
MAETNERGNTITRAFYGERQRYKYDLELCASADGWIQYDTREDAWYFGVWVHPQRRLILTFAEGDETLTECPTEAGYRAELADMAAFYGPPPPFAVALDNDGTVTHYVAERPQ